MKKHSLSSKERIKSKKEIESLYLFGRTIYSYDKKLKAVFLYNSNISWEGIKIAAAVSKKTGNAVWRNRVKRIIKESYRLNKHNLLPDILERHITLFIVFSPHFLDAKKNKIISLNDIISPVKELLNRIRQVILSEHQSNL